MKNILTIVCFLIFTIYSCKYIDISEDVAKQRIFNLTAYDLSGDEVFQGSIKLLIIKDSIKGSWVIFDGRNGELEGSIQGNKILINLNPGYSDNNILLNGTLKGNKLSGNWQQIGISGVIKSGYFSAINEETLK